MRLNGESGEEICDEHGPSLSIRVGQHASDCDLKGGCGGGVLSTESECGVLSTESECGESGVPEAKAGSGGEERI